MQSMDIHALDLDLVHSGTDQRKIHMLVREIFPKLKWEVPISLHHHLLPGLSEPVRLGITEDNNEDLKISSKMSKSKPMGSIFITDSTQIIEHKIKKAFCPIAISENNPVLEIVRYIIFKYVNEFKIERPEKYGGTITYDKYPKLQNDYVNRKIHPQDLKESTAVYLDKIIDPVRRFFKNNEPNFE
jgi:tyrosyl-tRNA synthetase